MRGDIIMQILNKLLLINIVVLILCVAGCGSNDNQQERPVSSVGLVATQFDIITDDQYEQLRGLLLGTKGVLSQKWGNKSAVNVTVCNNDPSLNQLHTGIDYGAALGTPVFSPTSGVVKRIARGNPLNSSVLSTLVIFNGQTRTSYIYLHMDTIDSNLSVGSSVTIGQQLGTVGARGRVTGPHLHFETRSIDSNPSIGIKLFGALCIDGTTNPFNAVINAR
jgi:murein DD-endopeptidase MepM/ murein hydrolase activator NlpD